MAANEFSMSVLSNKVPTPTLFLLGSGLIMVLTLWFSSKAKKVVKTSLDLSDQNHIKERFRPNFLSRILVRFFVGLNQDLEMNVSLKMLQYRWLEEICLNHCITHKMI